MQTHNIRFAVSLSDGRTLFEGKGILAEVIGELSPWQKLQNILVDDNVRITSFLLFTNDGRSFILPSAGSKPNFPIRGDQTPIDYNLFRALQDEQSVNSSTMKVVDKQLVSHYTVAEAVFSDYRLQIWVNELNTKECRTLIVK